MSRPEAPINPGGDEIVVTELDHHANVDFLAGLASSGDALPFPRSRRLDLLFSELPTREGVLLRRRWTG